MSEFLLMSLTLLSDHVRRICVIQFCWIDGADTLRRPGVNVAHSRSRSYSWLAVTLTAHVS